MTAATKTKAARRTVIDDCRIRAQNYAAGLFHCTTESQRAIMEARLRTGRYGLSMTSLPYGMTRIVELSINDAGKVVSTPIGEPVKFDEVAVASLFDAL